MHAFFSEHNGRFSLGAEPVDRYLAHNLSAAYPPSVIAEVKRLQRVYQITPNDHAFAALLRHGLDSAYAVTRYDPAGFARAFGHDLGGADRRQPDPCQGASRGSRGPSDRNLSTCSEGSARGQSRR